MPTSWNCLPSCRSRKYAGVLFTWSTLKLCGGRDRALLSNKQPEVALQPLWNWAIVNAPSVLRSRRCRSSQVQICSFGPFLCRLVLDCTAHHTSPTHFMCVGILIDRHSDYFECDPFDQIWDCQLLPRARGEFVDPDRCGASKIAQCHP